MARRVPINQQDEAYGRALVPEASLIDADKSEDDWVLLTPHEVLRPETSIPSSSAYLDFQLSTRYGKFSFTARPTSMTNKVTESELESGRIIHAQEQSPLFQLPVEIRLDIYEYLLRIPIRGSGVELTQRPARHQYLTCLTVLSTCRRVLSEAEQIFYSINRLSVEHPEKLWASLGPRRRSAITTFTLPVGSGGSFLHGLKQLRLFQNLTSLHIQRRASIKYQDVSSWAIMSHQLAAEIRGMKTLVGLEIFTPEAVDLTEHELVRKKKLEEIDQRIRDACLGRIRTD